MAPLELEQLHSDMLEAISERYQKTAGFPAYDFTRAFALAILSLDADITAAEGRMDIDTLTGSDLDDFIRQRRGISRRWATYATATLRVVSGEGEIHAGDLFSTASGVEFYAISDGTYGLNDLFEVRAYEAGARGNVGGYTISYMPVTIPGIAKVTNDYPATGGVDGESDDEFRNRYYEDLLDPGNGNNKASYVAMARSVPGIGRCKCFRVNSDQVKVVITNSENGPAYEAESDAVQAVIDPNMNGDGSGLAAIGPRCYVVGADRVPIAVSARVTLQPGYSIPEVTEAVRQRVHDYIVSISFLPETTELSFVQVATVVGGTPGILRVNEFSLNGEGDNVPLTETEAMELIEVYLE